MKLRWTVLLIGVWLLTPAVVQAQAQERPRRGDRPRLQRRQDRPPSMLQARIERIREELELDAEQQADFDRIAGEFREKRGRGENFGRRRSLMTELHRAREEGNDDRVAEIRKELKELRGGSLLEQFLDEVEGILRDDQREKLAEIRKRLADERSPGGRSDRGRLGELRRLRGELRLNDEQAKQYDQLFAKLKTELQQGRSGGDDADKIIKEIMKAAEAGDQERVKELRQQLPDPRQRSTKAIEDFLAQVESFLEPEQVRALERFRQRRRGGREQVDLRSCFRFVSRLGLDEQQRVTLREVRQDAHRAEREARRDPEALAQLTADVQQQLRDLLTAEQTAEFDKWLKSQKRGKPDRDRKGERPGRRHHKERPAEPGGEDTP